MRTEIPLWSVRIGQWFLYWPALCGNNKVNGIGMTTDFFESVARIAQKPVKKSILKLETGEE